MGDASPLLAARLRPDQALDDVFPAFSVGPQQIQSTYHIWSEREMQELLAFLPDAPPVSPLSFSVGDWRGLARRAASPPSPLDFFWRAALYPGHAGATSGNSTLQAFAAASVHMTGPCHALGNQLGARAEPPAHLQRRIATVLTMPQARALRHCLATGVIHQVIAPARAAMWATNPEAGAPQLFHRVHLVLPRPTPERGE